jgi:WD40 repeat protein
MTRSVLFLSLCAALCASVLQAQTTTPSPSFVYVSNTPVNSSNNYINGYTVAPDGSLTVIDGTPYYAEETDITVAQNTLFGIDKNVPSIDAFSIAADGAITYLTSTDYAQFNPDDCGGAGWVFPDRSATDIYAMEFDGDCANNTYESFATEPSGSVGNLGVVNGGAGSFNGVYLPAAFLGNNQFAYEATNNSCMYSSVSAFERTPSGLLTSSNATTTLPDPPDGYRAYYPTMLGADPTNHVAIALWPVNPPGCSTAPLQIGVFTADSAGNLTTTDTSATMPSTLVGDVDDLKISPAGDMLAVAGSAGLQVFHFNGASSVTEYTNLLTSDPISEMFWDRSNHLFALSQSSNKLHVFNVNGSMATEAPGSPYVINAPIHLAVYSPPQ